GAAVLAREGEGVKDRVLRVALVLAGVAGLLLRDQYAGPGQELVRCHAGNLCVSFALYFVATFLPWPGRFGRLLSAGLALAAVELFEATDGFGVMANTYDPLDFVANAAGVGLALGLDALVRRGGGAGPRPARRA
ncbi:MAG TPA: hypothetical protein P5076_21240, partial [Myxococcota bacterium]|nr:hypothetical protein [Myxococcota bacterium]